MNDLLTLDEIADALKMRRSYVRDRLVKQSDFPRPALALSQKNRRWSVGEVEAWMRVQSQASAR